VERSSPYRCRHIATRHPIQSREEGAHLQRFDRPAKSSSPPSPDRATFSQPTSLAPPRKETKVRLIASMVGWVERRESFHQTRNVTISAQRHWWLRLDRFAAKRAERRFIERRSRERQCEALDSATRSARRAPRIAPESSPLERKSPRARRHEIDAHGIFKKRPPTGSTAEGKIARLPRLACGRRNSGVPPGPRARRAPPLRTCRQAFDVGEGNTPSRIVTGSETLPKSRIRVN